MQSGRRGNLIAKGNLMGSYKPFCILMLDFCSCVRALHLSPHKRPATSHATCHLHLATFVTCPAKHHSVTIQQNDVVCNLAPVLKRKSLGDIRSERGQINFVALFLPLDQLTVSKDGYLILQFLRGKMELTEKLFTGDFASGFNEFTDCPLKLS